VSDLISVLLPTRNRAKLLARAIRSIQKQSWSTLEILILDDASSDATPELLERLADQDSRIRILRRNESKGLADGLNALIDMSRGRWLARMDDDDVSRPCRLEHQLAYIEANQIDVCGSWYQRRGFVSSSVMRPATEHEEIAAELLFQPPLLHPSIMLRRGLLELYGGYKTDFPHAEDYELWTRLAPHCRFGNIPEVLMDYTLSALQVSRHYNSAQVETARRVRADYLTRLDISHSAAEQAIHINLRNPNPIDDVNELRSSGAWLEYLASQFDPRTTYVFARQWLLCAVRAAGLGHPTYDTWKMSTLSNGIDRTQRALLLTLCIAKLRYGSKSYRLLEPFARS